MHLSRSYRPDDFVAFLLRFADFDCAVAVVRFFLVSFVAASLLRFKELFLGALVPTPVFDLNWNAPRLERKSGLLSKPDAHTLAFSSRWLVCDDRPVFPFNFLCQRLRRRY